MHALRHKRAAPPHDPASEALRRALEAQRKTDPLIGAQLGGREVFQRLLKGMNNERGVHIESLRCALGRAGGVEALRLEPGDGLTGDLPHNPERPPDAWRSAGAPRGS